MAANASGSVKTVVEGHLVEGATIGVAAELVLTARAAVGIAANELAKAAKCKIELINNIESGQLDPVLDTVERLVNSVGLEVRAGTGFDSRETRSADFNSEVRRVRRALVDAVEFRRSFGLGPPSPLRGTQRDWDGIEPAPARLFGAGPTRRDGDGWAAILVSAQRQRTGAHLEDIAAATSTSPTRVADIEAGRIRPPTGELKRLLSAMAATLRVRLEPYDDHDDTLHLRAIADPERYHRQLHHGETIFSNSVVLG